MGAYAPAPAPQKKDDEADDVIRTVRVLGGDAVIGHRVTTQLDAHELLVTGLPAPALHHLVDSVHLLDDSAQLENALGISVRTVQRSRANPDHVLSPDQSGRAWKFAEVVALATDVLGSQPAAEEWMVRPAIALDRRRPIDLLSTPAGVELVETLLHRIEYGVYT